MLSETISWLVPDCAQSSAGVLIQRYPIGGWESGLPGLNLYAQGDAGTVPRQPAGEPASPATPVANPNAATVSSNLRRAAELARKNASEAARDAASEETPPSFEESLERLEQIVQQLEQGRLGLSDSLERYEEGVRHLKQCYRALETAERKIELLASIDAAGNPVTQAYDDADLPLDEKAAGRTQRRSRPAPARPPAACDDEDPTGRLF